MKHLKIAVPLLILLIVCAFSLKTEKLATPKKIDGYYIYLYSEPIDNYEKLGRVESPSVVWSKSTKVMFSTLLKRLKKQHPKADGIILDDNMYGGTAIIFKD